MVRRGLVLSRADAARAIESNMVLVNGAIADKSSRLVDRPQGRRNLRPGDSAFHETCLRTLSMTARSGLYRVRVGTPGVLLY